MHLKETGAPVRKPVKLAIWVVLLGSLFAAGATQAQNKTSNDTWQSHIATDQPEVIFRTYCAACHGANGDGKGVEKIMLDPAPADFTSAKKRSELSRAHMIETVNKGTINKNGKPTAMVGWKSHLSREQVEAVVDYVIVSFMDGKLASNTMDHSQGHQHQGHDHSAMNVATVDYPYGLKPAMPSGKSIYSAQCAKCHGDKGDGQGNPAVVGKTRPRNFLDPEFQRVATGFTLYSAVSNGRGHMPGWNKALSKQEIADVSEFVLQTFAKPR